MEWGKVAHRPLCRQAAMGMGVLRRAPVAPCAEAERGNGGAEGQGPARARG
jgi:hypothetical protein